MNNILLVSRSKIDYMVKKAADLLQKSDFNVFLAAFSNKELVKNYKYLDIPINYDNSTYIVNDNEFEDLLKKVDVIEDKLGINCFEAHQNYLLYGKYVRRYGGEYNYVASNSYRLAIKEFVEAFEKIEAFVKENNINYVFVETIDWVETYILNAMANKGYFEMFSFFWQSIDGKHRVRLATTKDRYNPKLNILYKYKLFSKKSLEEAKRIILDFREKKIDSYYKKIHKRSVFDKYNLFELTGKINKVNLNFYINRTKAKKFFKKELPKERFLIYFLQHTPEASVVSAATLWNEQQNLLELLSVSAKGGYKIVVKEHPRTFGRRPWQFYEELNYFKNIHFIDVGYDSQDILKKSEGVITLTSSTGFDGLLLGKKVFTLAKPYISISKNVKVLNSPFDVWKNLEYEIDDEDNLRFVASLLESSYDFPKGDMKSIFPKSGGGEVIAKMLIDNIKFIKKYGKVDLDEFIS